ncbi:MAG: phage integrase central domain-containing protein [Alphaproteobacteria bacterium]
MEAYVLRKIGERRIVHIDMADVLRVLAPIWLSKPETSRQVH